MIKTKLKYAIVRFVSLFMIISSVLALNVFSASYDNIYNNSINLSTPLISSTFNPNISLYSVNSGIQVTLETTSGISVIAYKRGTIPDSEYEKCINYMYENFPHIPEIDKLDEPSYSYNCHSYAWYDRSKTNTYWINLPNDFIGDPHCSDELAFSELRADDIVTYWTVGKYYDNYGNDCYGYHCAHSAVVDSIEGTTVTCVSKWGPAGLYRHKMDDVPPEYKYNGMIDVKYYRYTQEEHDLYMYEDNGEDGCIVKCSANKSGTTCPYTLICDEAPEYEYTSTGHYASCPSGCYSFYQDHDLVYSQIIGDLYSHTARCSVCGYTYSESHTWVLDGVTQLYICSDCGYASNSDKVPGIMSLTDEELEAYLATLTDEERDAFIAGLDPEARDRVTSILDPSDDELVTE